MRSLSELAKIYKQRKQKKTKEFQNQLDKIVQKFVKLEFKNEILPVLIQHINDKIDSLRSITKEQVKECISEVLSDMILSLNSKEE